MQVCSATDWWAKTYRGLSVKTSRGVKRKKSTAVLWIFSASSDRSMRSRARGAARGIEPGPLRARAEAEPLRWLGLGVR